MSGFRFRGEAYFCKECGELVTFEDDMVRKFVAYVKSDDRRRLEVQYDYYHLRCWYEKEGLDEVMEGLDKAKAELTRLFSSEESEESEE